MSLYPEDRGSKV